MYNFDHFRPGRCLRGLEIKPKPPSNRKLYLAFGAAILVLLGLGLTSYRDMVESAESNRWVRHTHEVMENLQDLSSAMDSAESSSHGYVWTGQESYVETYRATSTIAERDIATIRGLTDDNLLQRSRIPELERLTAAKSQFGDRVINLRRAHGLDAATEEIRIGAGRRMTDELQTLIRNMEGEELRLLELRNADAKRSLRRAKIILFLGTLLGVLIVAGAGRTVRRDSSARDLAEEALRDGEERFRSIANNISQLAWMADEKGSIFWYNQRWFDYSGTTPEEMLGWGWQKMLHPDHVRRVMDKISRCLQSSEVWEDTFPLRGRDGNYCWFLSRAVPIRDSDGKVLRWFGTNTDISERLDAEKHLAQMESKFRGLLEAAPDAMVVVNQSGEIVLLNIQAQKQFGYRPDELVGQRINRIIPEGFAERLIADGARSAAEALAQHIGTGIELVARRKDGSEFPIEIMLSPLESHEGILVTAAIRDISARKKAEELLVKTIGELKGSNDELQQFAYVASHDLQEPLRMVASYTELLAKRYKGRLDSDADEFIAFAVDGCNRMRGLIQDLLAYSRAGTTRKALRQISGEDAFREALTNLRITVERSGAVVTHDSLPEVLADDTQLTQVFQNLVGNAIKYHREAVPHVHVTAAKSGDNEWIFSVRDNGLGIDSQYFERIFVLFQRLHGRAEFEGTGIGLAVCKKLLERMGGRIWVESEPGIGSNFCFALPERDEY
jgi:PAS domain S-box-containing protein